VSLSSNRQGIGTTLFKNWGLPQKFLMLCTLSLMASTVYGLIDDPVSQRSILKQYQPSVMYEHTFFDMSILDGTSLVQADSQATYFLAR